AKLGNGSANPAYGTYINSIAESQPVLQSSLNSSSCKGTFTNGTGAYANCTAAVIDNELSDFLSQSVLSIWSDLDNGNFNSPRTMMNTAIPAQANGTSGQMTSGVAVNASLGY